ncbi:uncharacterized protein MONBRDRAFT_36692 [Monosiga brevicollis MX1]|uniref:Alpha-type protein kinase domain-containing protein n=1 Tax=Monosiga brevicollis TaxID=81824 RepID=A9UWW9_MONBE|nr:uncharacterized protein MONBRDRAFT_36692 [Monosiga brevicollis MX1]EDQ90115.1 predicted protein [Monosiga brevicollis MX1]|eukprot:XP_001744882.1 hypothetical protein [Monosiga brevicollis MX1]
MALIFFALLPHWLWPLIYLAERLGLTDFGDLISLVEILVGAVASGLVLPIIILTPLLQTLDLTPSEYGMLLFNIIILPSVWLPLVVAIFQTPIVVDAKRAEDLQPQRQSFSDHAELRGEFSVSYGSYFLLASVPFGIFLPLFIHGTTNAAGEAAVLFFLLLLGSASALLLVAPRLGWVLHQTMRWFKDVASYRALAEGVLCLVVLPVCLMVPVLAEVHLNRPSYDVLQAWLLGLPAVTLLRMTFTLHREAQYLPSYMAGVFLVVDLPCFILLPAWIAAHPVSMAGEVTFLVFMLVPLVAALALVVYLTFTSYQNLPFHLLTKYLEPEWWVEQVLATLIFSAPMLVAVPVYFRADLDPTTDYVLVGFLVVIEILLAVAFLASYALRQNDMPDAISLAPTIARSRAGTAVSRSDAGLMRGPAHAQFSAQDLESRRGTMANARRDSVDPTHVDADGLPAPADSAPAPAPSNASAYRPSVVSAASSQGGLLGHRVPGSYHATNWGSISKVPKDFDPDAFEEPAAMAGSPLNSTVEVRTYDLATPLGASGRTEVATVLTDTQPPPSPGTSFNGSDAERLTPDASTLPALLPSAEREPVHAQTGDDTEYEIVPLPERSDDPDKSEWEHCDVYDLDASSHLQLQDRTCSPFVPAAARVYAGSSRAHTCRRSIVVSPACVSMFASVTVVAAYSRVGFLTLIGGVFLFVSESTGEDLRQGAYHSAYPAYLSGTEDSFVLKWPCYATMQTQEASEIGLSKVAHASRIAQAFNAALGRSSENAVSFAQPRAVQLTARPAANGRVPWALLEPELEDLEATGVMDYFCIFNDSAGGVVSEEDMQDEVGDHGEDWREEFRECNDLAQALSCYSYHASQRQELMINIQGVRHRYTNPDFHFASAVHDPYFSPHNNGPEGIAAFQRSHVHNDFCRLALPSLPGFTDSWLTS